MTTVGQQGSMWVQLAPTWAIWGASKARSTFHSPQITNNQLSQSSPWQLPAKLMQYMRNRSQIISWLSVLWHQWAGAGVGVGMLWGGGIPFIENEQLQRFKVSNYQRFKVSKGQSFKDSEIPFHVFVKRYWSHIQDFEEFIRPISRMFRHASFPEIAKTRFSRFGYFPNKNRLKGFGIFLNCLK